ncbi:MAG TPA: cysteine desulfurase family protein [Bryobacteraceae bacterium]|nr:cysteine desulfurase family protein [Bryobacteraceae bacterium]
MRRCYFDHNATTPVHPDVLEAYVPALADVYGNASSIHHFGQMARQRLEMARRRMAGSLGCEANEIVFTSGGTEADNLAIFGVLRARRGPAHVITTAIEHPAVLAACRRLESDGVEVTYIAPSPRGVVDPDDVRRALRPHTALISVMHVNNETGAIQPIAEIGAIAREAAVPFHVDGVQAAGRIPVRLDDLPVDLYSLSAHKVYAPKGVGALFVRSSVSLSPVMFGGRHERERRAGTENVAGAFAMSHALEIALADLEDESERLSELRNLLEQGITERVPQATVNAAGAPRAPNTTNILFEGIEGEAVVISLDLKGFAVSSGSACSSGAVEPSHVLLAMGLPRDAARSSVRFSLGRENTLEQVDALIEAVAVSAEQLRRLSPACTARA